MSQPIKVFVSYAHKDDSFKKELDIQLKLIGMQMPIKVWSDEDIDPTQLWDKEIKDALANADVVLLLVSNDFLVSNYINNVEIEGALERYDRGETAVLPIILRPTDFGSFEISKFQALPRRAKPISAWDDRDEAWLNVSQGLKKVFDSISKKNLNSNPKVNTNSDGNNSTQNNSVTTSPSNQNPPTPSQNLSNTPIDAAPILKEAQSLIADGKTKKALELLSKYTQSQNLDNEYSELILQSSKLSNIKKEELQGIRNSSEIRVEMARINKALLSIISDLKEEAK